MVDLRTSVGSLALANPVIPASGTFAFGAEMAERYDLNLLGAICLKGTTLQPRPGNPGPRIAECTEGVLNSVGLENPGIDRVIGEKIPALRACFRGPVILNVSGFSVEEYVLCSRRAASCSGLDALEINISCPNVEGGGLAFGTDPETAAAVTAAVKRVSGSKPVFVKLSPNVTDIVRIARACEEAGADGLTLVNTFLGMRIDIVQRKPVLSRTTGGFSGRAIFPVALRMVYEVSRACRIPVMGCGGVSSAREVIEMMMAGASGVQVGAEHLRNPMVCKEIVEALPACCEELGIRRLRDIIGIA